MAVSFDRSHFFGLIYCAKILITVIVVNLGLQQMQDSLGMDTISHYHGVVFQRPFHMTNVTICRLCIRRLTTSTSHAF